MGLLHAPTCDSIFYGFVEIRVTESLLYPQNDNSDHRRAQEKSRFPAGNPSIREAVLRAGRSWNYPGDFRQFLTGKNWNMAGKISRPGILLP